MLLVNACGECIRYDSIEKMSTLIILKVLLGQKFSAEKCYLINYFGTENFGRKVLLK